MGGLIIAKDNCLMPSAAHGTCSHYHMSFCINDKHFVSSRGCFQAYAENDQRCKLISRKKNDDHEFADRCWNCNHGESIPGEKCPASFGEILPVLFFVASYDARYEVNFRAPKGHA